VNILHTVVFNSDTYLAVTIEGLFTFIKGVKSSTHVTDL